MANVTHGPFTPGASTATGSYGTGVGQVNTYTSGNANNDETQSAVALNSFNGDLFTAFVLSGVTCAKDGTTASQLDVASGVAYLKQSDGSLARCDVGATTFSTTGNASATMYLDLNPDGSWSWATTHSAVSNHLTICSVTTDGSANIATVSDARTRNTTLLSGLGDVVILPNGAYLPGGAYWWANTGIGGAFPQIMYIAPAGATVNNNWAWLYSGGDGRILLQDETANKTALEVYPGGQTGFPHGLAEIGLQNTVGSFGVPVIVAQGVNIPITTTGLQIIGSFSAPATGLYRISMTLTFSNVSSTTITCKATYIDPNTGGSPSVFFSGGPTLGYLNGASFGAGTATYALPPLLVYADAGGMGIDFDDSAGTPNDHISYIVERLS